MYTRCVGPAGKISLSSLAEEGQTGKCECVIEEEEKGGPNSEERPALIYVPVAFLFYPTVRPSRLLTSRSTYHPSTCKVAPPHSTYSFAA